MQNKKLILYISCSIDGYIAQPNDDLSFLSMVEKEGEDYGYTNLVASTDTVIIGRKTYDWVLKHIPEYPHADKDVYVITKTERPNIGNIFFYTGELATLVTQLKNAPNPAQKHIYCDGGAEIVNELLRHSLIDELIISIIPILLGNGTRLFKDGNRPEQPFQLLSAQAFETGLVQLHYKRADFEE